jgi:Hypothetical protein (DUF2513)
MKRNMDLVRDLLLKIEELDLGDGNWVDVSDMSDDGNELYQHLILMRDEGLIEGSDRQFAGKDGFLPTSLTWAGHDFLDSVRDPEIWQKTKDGAKAAGGFTVELLAEIAKGLIKTQIKRLSGVDV